jgi:hypothetical protein
MESFHVFDKIGFDLERGETIRRLDGEPRRQVFPDLFREAAYFLLARRRLRASVMVLFSTMSPMFSRYPATAMYW